ncbi:MAG: PstS family phosphate ABC transporter substrate-binding protein [Phycisphaerales bacterium]|nr:PstS family phosphate ABC transporter substrate-binding protein [Phycisphaerales bacterium]
MLNRYRTPARPFATLFVTALVGSAVAQNPIRIDGSSTVFPITEAVAEEFQAANRGLRVVVGISGTGGGFKKFGRGETDISDASRPILAGEMEACRAAGINYIEVPIAFDALTVMVHPSNDWVKELTIEDLRKIWEPDAQRRIMRWNQVRADWPDAPLNLYGAGSDSGTFDYFTEAVTGTAKSSRTDFTASEDDNVLVQGIANDRHALGFFGYAYYAENKDKLRAVPIVNPKGKAVLPSEETVMNGSYSPLSRPVFLYINVKSLERDEVRRFVEFFLKHVADLAREVKYVPLPPEAYRKAHARVEKREIGTAFGGHSETGLEISELFNRPLTTTPHPATTESKRD